MLLQEQKLCTHSTETAIHNMKWSQVLESELRYFRKFPLAGSTVQCMDVQSVHVCSEQGCGTSVWWPQTNITHWELIVHLLLNSFLVISCSKILYYCQSFHDSPPYIQVCNHICGHGPHLKKLESVCLHRVPHLSDLVKWLFHRNCSFSFWN